MCSKTSFFQKRETFVNLEPVTELLDFFLQLLIVDYPNLSIVLRRLFILSRYFVFNFSMEKTQ